MIIYKDVPVSMEWGDDAPRKFGAYRHEYDKLMIPAAANLGISATAVEYYMGIWIFYSAPGCDELPQVPEDVKATLSRLAGSHAPHVVLKAYRIQRGLE